MTHRNIDVSIGFFTRIEFDSVLVSIRLIRKISSDTTYKQLLLPCIHQIRVKFSNIDKAINTTRGVRKLQLQCDETWHKISLKSLRNVLKISHRSIIALTTIISRSDSIIDGYYTSSYYALQVLKVNRLKYLKYNLFVNKVISFCASCFLLLFSSLMFFSGKHE